MRDSIGCDAGQRRVVAKRQICDCRDGSIDSYMFVGSVSRYNLRTRYSLLTIKFFYRLPTFYITDTMEETNQTYGSSNTRTHEESQQSQQSVENPFRHSWVFWFMHRQAGSKIQDYNNEIKKVCTIHNVCRHD